MSWPVLETEDALARLRAGARGLDVRSEGEFATGALPGFANVPVLRDDHRHLVGLCYKRRGPEEAQNLGRELVEPLREALVARWREVLSAVESERRVLICWRGGLRSSSVAEALAHAGIEGYRVNGGYKALRAELLRRIEDPPPLVVLTGSTGSGKTEILRRVPGALDLEGLANHRGSAFGADVDSTQPAQQTFENAIGMALLEPRAVRAVEDESATIGRNVVPPPLRRRMQASPVVMVDVPLEERVARSFEDYVARPARVFGRARTHAHLARGLEAIGSRLGGLRLRELRAAIDAGFAAPELELERFADPIRRLLLEYYDPSYLHGLERAGRPIAFRGTTAEVTDWLVARATGDSKDSI